MVNLCKTVLVGLVASVSLNICAQVSNNNQDGVYRMEQHAHAATYRPGEVIVKFKEDVSVRRRAGVNGQLRSLSNSSVDKLLNKLGVKEAEQLMPLTASKNSGTTLRSYNGQDVEVKDLTNLYTLKFDESEGNDVHAAIDQLKELDEVEYAEPNYIVYMQRESEDPVVYDDPLFSEQWGVQAIKVDQLWSKPKITKKRSVIAILDTGVDTEHPDLKDNIWTNEKEAEGEEDTDDDGNGFKDDIHGWDFVNNTPKMRDNNGHGTHCAGIAAAVGGNGIGIVGANPDALIMPITVMQSDGTGDIATIIKGVDYASANGADVISMSLGGYFTSIAYEQALGKAYATSVLVAAAGNDGHFLDNPGEHCFLCSRGLPMYPAAYAFVLGVEASSNKDGVIASFSNLDNSGPIYSSYGEEKLYNYELRAPGVDIMSTYPSGRYKKLNGTSMACPLVAGAVSRLLESKEYSSKELLFGDLIASTKGNLDIYNAYNIIDEERTPTLELITYNIDDSRGDNDGRFDAGETIDIYPVIRNAWGQAKNIKISMSVAENEDPDIVEFLTNNVDFGKELSSYSKGTSLNPIRIKVADDCVDGRHISLVLTITCENIKEDISKNIVVTVENGVELGGMITEDMVLYPNTHYIVTRNMIIPKGVSLTIQPGTVVKFEPNVSLFVYREVENNYNYGCIIRYIDDENSGKLIVKGTKENPITFELRDKSFGSFFVGAESMPQVCTSGNRKTWNRVDSFTRKDIIEEIGEGVSDTIMGLERYAKNSLTFEYVKIKDGVISGFCYENCVSDGGCIDGIVNRSNIFNTEKYNSTSSNCAYTNIGNVTECVLANFVFNCNILPSINEDGNYMTVGGGDYGTVYKSEYPSYLGSSNYKIAKNYVQDFDKGFQSSCIDISNMLLRPSAEAHGIVWKVVVNGYDAQDEFEQLTPLGVGKHKFEVYFNRPMDVSVAPSITMGVRPPYTQTSIAEEGSWSADSTIYTAYLNITGKSDFDGLNRIRVYGAKDNEHFEIPEEYYRFNVEVQKAGSMSTGLMAEAGLGKVALTWETDEEDFEDLLGFNVYRYTEKDTIPRMINTTLIEPDGTEFTDFDVEPGTTYYYSVREMATDLSQSVVSNIVAATPLTASKGDANGSMTVDVADVVTEVAYLTNQDPQPFIFEAADVNSDEIINILDVVGTVNIIKNPTTTRSASMSEHSAVYSIEDGILYVQSNAPIAGVQVTFDADPESEMTAMSGLHSMERAGTWTNEGEYMLLAYSMSDKVIPSGKQPLLKVGDAQLRTLVLSDALGGNMETQFNQVIEEIDNMDQVEEEVSQNENMVVRIFDIAGRRVPEIKPEMQGVYIVMLYQNGELVKSYKLLNK